MKRIVIVLLFFTFLGVDLFSFDFWTKFKGGGNMSKYRGAGSIGSTDRISFNGGLAFEFGFVNAFAIQTEFLIVENGASYSLDEVFPIGTELVHVTSANIKKTYFELPVLFKLRFLRKKPVKLNIYAGPSFAFLLKAEREISGEIEGAFLDGTSVSLTEDITESTAKNEIGVVFGGGMEIALGKKALLLFDLRYRLGLTPVDVINFSFTEKKNSSLIAMAGLGFRF